MASEETKVLTLDGLQYFATKMKNHVKDEYVAKKDGYDLSSNDYTDAEKTKLAGIYDSADAVSFSRSLSKGTKIGTITINGAGTDLYCETNTDTTYSAGSNISISSDRKISGNYPLATTSVNGLMSAGDKAKLDGTDDYANKIGSVKVNGTALTVASDKSVDIDLSDYALRDSLSKVATSGKYSDLSGTPDSLKNPDALTLIAGSTTVIYNGDGAQTFEVTKTSIGLGNVTNQSKTDMFKNAALTEIPTAPTANAGTNTSQIATTAFVQTAVNNKFASVAGALVHKGTITSNSQLPANHKVGEVYIVATAGTYAGKVCEVGDMIICRTAGTSANNAHWDVVQTNINGAVTGPSSAVNERVAIFNGTTGKAIKDSGKTIADLMVDTKNSAGATDTSSKIFLVGAPTQGANPQTYTHDTAYVGTDGNLYSGGELVATKRMVDENKAAVESTYLPLSGGKLAGDIDLDKNRGFIGTTGTGNHFDIFRLISSTRLQVGGSYPTLELKGKNERPTYNNSDVALLSDVMEPVAVTSSDGVNYTATAPQVKAASLSELKGVKLVIIPNVTSTNAYNVSLNVNGLGAKLIKRWDNTDTGEFWSFLKPSWFKEGYPVTVTFNGTYWMIEGMNKPYASDLSGSVAIANGGTGATTLEGAKTNLGIPTNYIKSGSQTSTSTADEGSNVYTFTNADGTTSTFTVKNGSKGSPGTNGTNGTSAGFGTPTATVDANTGTPSVTVTASGSNTAKVFNFAFKNLKGRDGVSCTHSWSGTTLTVTSASGTSSANLKGADGVTPTIKAANGASIASVGTPSVTASTSGTTTTFTFNNLKGAKGDPGDDGITPTIKAAAGSAIGSVGTPSVTASTSGTTTTFTFNNLKGETGATGATGPQGPPGPVNIDTTVTENSPNAVSSGAVYDMSLQLMTSILTRQALITKSSDGGFEIKDGYGYATTIYPPTSAGTAGQIWVSDGSGQGAWRTLVTISTAEPSGGSDGDLWFQYEE